jgi:hypothetical protein
MTLHLSSAVIHGFLSNEIPGLISGQISLAGRAIPVSVELEGNFLSDIAGCRVEFTNPLPEALLNQTQVMPHQIGSCGEMTASRRLTRVPRAARTVFAPAAGLKNLVLFEWFNTERQRIVLQSWHWSLRVSAPRWQQDRERELFQIKQNRALRRNFLLNPPRRTGEDAMFGTPALNDPFAPQAPVADPFSDPAKNLSQHGQAPPAGENDPFSSAALSVKISASALAAELRDLETLLGVIPRTKAREPMLDLMSSISDLAVQLRHTAHQLSVLRPDCWAPLIIDVEQSIPLFVAGAAACGTVLDDPDAVLPDWWNNACSRLKNVVIRCEELLAQLRAG